MFSRRATRQSLMLLALLGSGCVSLPGRDPGIMSRAAREMEDGLRQRGIEGDLALYQKYTRDKLEASDGLGTFSDKTGNCRLAWVQQLLSNPIEAPAEAERFTRELHASCLRAEILPNRVLDTAADKLGLTLTRPEAEPAPKDALQALEAALARAAAAHARALAPLTEDELEELKATLYPVTTQGKANLGHCFSDVREGRRVADLLEKTDQAAWIEAAQSLAAWLNRAQLGALAAGAGTNTCEGVTGYVTTVLDSDAGRIIVGGAGANTYDLAALPTVCAIVDPEGDDTYLEGQVSPSRPVLLIVDLQGNDTYRGEQPGIQGGARLGVSILFDGGGNDVYEALDISQGACLGGVGILIDTSGDDRYVGLRRCQGQAIAGIGWLMDRSGDDQYRAALLAQGVGGPLGFGLLADEAGADHYFAGGLYKDGYDDSPGFGGWSQGVGVGPRGSANGGIGVLLDGGGDDIYESDYFGHAGGYWFAAGFARDFGGNDQRLGATTQNYDGSERTEKRFLRWGVGYGCHYAAGFLFDDAGNDDYIGNTACIGFGWDIGIACLYDLEGNDTYSNSGGAAQAHNASFSVLCDAAGDDHYSGASLGLANPKVQYHPKEQCGGNFVFLIDFDGVDDYGKDEALDHTVRTNGWAGSFLIDK